MSALNDAIALRALEPKTHMSGPEWERLVDRLVAELVETHAIIERLQRKLDVKKEMP